MTRADKTLHNFVITIKDMIIKFEIIYLFLFTLSMSFLRELCTNGILQSGPSGISTNPFNILFSFLISYPSVHAVYEHQRLKVTVRIT